MEFSTTSSPHLPDNRSVSRVMLNVMLAMLPGIAALSWFCGWGVLTNLMFASAFALLFEGAILAMRQRPIAHTLGDNTALLTAWLLAVAMPPMSSWWLIAIGMLFAIVVAKQLYGGLGHNPFNPAMVGYVVLLISFPTYMTRWLSPGDLALTTLSFSDTLAYALGGHLPTDLGWDALTTATVLDTTKVQLGLERPLSEIMQADIFGFLGGYGMEWVAIAWGIGGIWLLVKGVIDWRTPLALLLGLALPALLFHFINNEQYLSAMTHLFSGAAIFAAFFIATDPVSGCTSVRGRIIFAAGIGLLTWIIRTWGGYPDGVAFAVLLMNMAAPMIDNYTQPRVYGARKA